MSGPTAGALHGLRSMPTAIVELTVKRRHVLLPAPCRLVQTTGSSRSATCVLRPDGIRVASPLRMLFGLAGQFNQFRFERAAEDVWHRARHARARRGRTSRWSAAPVVAG